MLAAVLRASTMQPMAATEPGTPRLNLRPMHDDEYGAWRSALVDGYARDIEVNGDTPPEAARRKAEEDTARILPDGLQTAGHGIFMAEHDGQIVGKLWVAEREIDGRRILFVYDVEVDEPERGKGYGRAAMLLAEDEARRRGIARIELNVFGGNEVARRLYLSLGYVERAVLMGKDLSASQAPR